MVSILPSARSPFDVIGADVGQALQGILPGAIQQGYNRGMIQKSFDNLNPQGDFLEQMKSVVPTLASTPGGAQALEAIMPLLGKHAENRAYRGFLDNQRNQVGQQQSGAQNVLPYTNQQQPEAPTDEDYYRNPQAYASPESLYPERTIGPQEQPEMSLPEINQKALDLMDQSQATGKPISFPEALNAVQTQNSIIQQQNAKIKAEKGLQEEKNSKLAENMVNRARNSGLIKNPEDTTVAEKLALEARRLPDENKQWEYVRNGLRKFDENKSKILRSADVTGPFGKLWRKGMGNYQDKQELISGIQPAIDEYKKYGLFDELRADLGDYLGLGPRDIENAIFPLKKDQRQQISVIPKNQVLSKNEFGETPLAASEVLFPGQEFKLSPEKFDSFKESIGNILDKNKGINLVSLMDVLNSDKRYAWQDISRSIEELASEGRFVPDVIQEKQLGIINKPPAPGLADLFRYTWQGTR